MSDFFSGLLSALTPVHGSGVIVEETRSLDPLHGVVLQISGDLSIQFGEKEQILLKGEDNILPLVETEVKDGILKIGFKPKTSISLTRSISYQLTLKQLDMAETTSSGEINVPAMKANQLTLASKGSGEILSGILDLDVLSTSQHSSGRIELAGLNADMLGAEIKGSGSLRIDGGRVKKVEVRLTSSGKLEAEQLSCLDEAADRSEIEITGSGDAEIGAIHAQQTSLRLTSAGNLTISKLQTDHLAAKISGSGDVKILAGKAQSQEIILNSAGKYLADSLRASGGAKETSIRVTGSGNAFPGELIADKADIELTSSGKVSVRRLETDQFLSAVKGSGHLTVESGVVGNIDLKLTSAGNFTGHGLAAFDQAVENVSIRVSGSGSAHLGAIHAASVLLTAVSAGDLKVEQLQADSLEVQVKGSGNIKVRGGQAQHANVKITSSGDYRAYDLLAQRAELRSSGSGNARLNVNERLDVAILSSGDVSYRGNPIITYAKDGSGEIKKSSG
jgi:hypothetical protein